MIEQGVRKKIALFIDSENISYKLIEKILKELNAMGEVCVKKAYGDWRRDAMRGWDEILNCHSIEPIHIITGNSNKSNSSDIRLTIDVMHTLYEGKMECIALATSDSDFAPLAQEIRTKGVESIGFGEQKSRDDLRNAFSHFYELYLNKEKSKMIQNKEAQKPYKNKDIENIEILKRAIIANLNKSGWASLSQVGSYLKKEYRITPADYKRATWSKVFTMFPDDFALKNENSFSFVSLKKYSKSTKHPISEKYKKICNFFGFSH
ncbi:NYN domain-containing protein [Helicobacter cholecystus]|uniref:NYN domain-containing protein n=1 Tax=Helicobacter cholecystus TaxID=45498 RepID=A0A3D8IWC2_9HELI|nr:NYN domain-containing protein [Helicobacter cholecystus]RDU69589.1 NYN domain-containing protein [Helicobacter cholecystus]VEJ24146.1 NYN domain [Helicobacter cholecystus]